MPTEQCNFRCVYCYEEFRMGLMKPEIVAGLKGLVKARKPDLRYLLVSWFGGEPMLAYKIIVDMMEFINHLNTDGKTVVHSKMSTNGYLLTPEKFRRLVLLGVKRYQISFDGDKKEHDKLRVFRDESPTFDTIWQNLISAHNTDLDFITVVRVHVNKLNARSVRNFLNRLADSLQGDSRFRLFIRPLSKLGGHNDSTLPILEGEHAELVRELKEYAETLGLFLNYGDGRAANFVCHASKLNSFLIRPNGQIGKCSCNPYNDRNNVGMLQSDGTIYFDRDKLLWWSRGIFSGDSRELACPLNA
jgi:uncharacterized protein